MGASCDVSAVIFSLPFIYNYIIEDRQNIITQHKRQLKHTLYTPRYTHHTSRCFYKKKGTPKRCKSQKRMLLLSLTKRYVYALQLCLNVGRYENILKTSRQEFQRPPGEQKATVLTTAWTFSSWPTAMRVCCLGGEWEELAITEAYPQLHQLILNPSS